jgi:hypothetical protein
MHTPSKIQMGYTLIELMIILPIFLIGLLSEQLTNLQFKDATTHVGGWRAG